MKYQGRGTPYSPGGKTQDIYQHIEDFYVSTEQLDTWKKQQFCDEQLCHDNGTGEQMQIKKNPS